MTNIDSLLKRRDITLLTKVNIIKTMVFLVVRYRFESWTMKAEHQRIDAFELWCWRRLLRIPWTVRRLIQSILKEINPEYSLEKLMLKLQLQYFGYLIQRADLLENTLMMGKTEGRKSGWQRMLWLDSITKSMHMNLSQLQEIVEYRVAWYAIVRGVARVGHVGDTEQQQQQRAAFIL